MIGKPSFYKQIPENMILKQLTISRFASNCYIVGSVKSREGIIIDPGGDDDVILKCINELELKINLIVATHLHRDHYGALGKVKKATGAPFAAHANEVSEESRSLHGHPLPEPDKVLMEGDILSIGELCFSILHTPGHSPGSICISGHDIVFTGDTLLNGDIGKTGSPGTSREQLENSIRTKLMVLPDHTIVLPGHGNKTTIGAERRNSSFSH